MRTSSRARRWEVSAALACAIVAGISVAASAGRAGPLLTLVHSLPGADTLGHFLLMGGLAFVVSFAFVGEDPRSQVARWRVVVVALGSLLTFDECLQIVLPRRAFSLVDLGANLAGVVVFSLVALLLRRSGASDRGESRS